MSNRKNRASRHMVRGVAVLDAIGDAILAEHDRREKSGENEKPAPLHVSMMKATAEAKGRR